MRAFIALCLLAVASAQSGYNYNQPAVQETAAYQQAAPSNGYIPPASGALNLAQPINNYQQPESHAAPQANYEAPAELQKEFYTFSANEGDFYDPVDQNQAGNSLRKGLRVVFIKNPENSGLENAAVALAKHAAQQDTAIYVLNKQADIGDLANKLNNVGSNRASKPVVHFVKYRTNEDAANAQRTIQSQYDDLGGSTSYQDGGVAPVLNFASPGASRNAAPVSQPDNSYLPASVLRKRL